MRRTGVLLALKKSHEVFDSCTKRRLIRLAQKTVHLVDDCARLIPLEGNIRLPKPGHTEGMHSCSRFDGPFVRNQGLSR